MKNIILTASTLDLYACRRKLNWVENIGYRPVGSGEATPMDGGTFWHRILEYYYNARKEGKSVQEARLLAITNARAFGITTPLAIEDIEQFIDWFDEYLGTYGDEGNWKILGAEEKFIQVLWEGEVGGEMVRIILQGTSDLRVETNSKETRVIDHKSQGRDHLFPPLGNQPLSYCTGWETKLFSYNILNTSQKPKKRFKRQPLSFSQDTLTEWKNGVIEKGIAIYESFRDNYWPEDLSQCGTYYRDCQFAEICVLPPRTREAQLKLTFNIDKTDRYAIKGEGDESV